MDWIYWNGSELIVPDSPNGTVLAVSAGGSSVRQIAAGLARPTGAWAEPDGNLIVTDSVKRQLLIMIGLLLVILLSACTNSSVAAVPVESVLSQVDVAVTATRSSMATTSALNTPTPTATLLPTTTSLS